MKNTRMAQQLRALSMKPSMESEGENAEGSTTETGPAGDGVVKTDIEPAQDVQADGAGAPAEDQDLAAKTVTVDEGPKEETAETTSADDGENVVVSQEGVGGGVAGALAGFLAGGPIGALAGVVAGHLLQEYAKKYKKIKSLKKALEGADDEEKAEIRDQLEELGEDVEYLSRQIKREAKKAKVSQESEGEDGAGSDTITGDGEQVVKTDIEPAQDVPADGAGAPGEDKAVSTTTVEVGERSDLETAETASTDSKTTVSTESITLAALGFVGLSVAFSSWFTHKYQNTIKEVEKLQAEVAAKKEELKKAEEEFVARAKAAIEKAKAEGKKETVSQEGVSGAVGGALYGALSSALWGPFIGPLVSLGVWGSSWALAVAALKKQREELQKLETKLADRQLDLATRVAAAEQKFDVSQESVDDNAAAANAAVAAAAAVAEGAAAAAEAAAAAADAATDTPAEVVAADDTAVEGTDIGASEMEELEEAIEAGEEHAEKYENEVTTLESLIETLEDARRTGGLTPQSARIFQISFESMGVRLTGAPFKNQHGENAMPSLESFGGTGRRIDATQASLESAQGVLAKIIEVLKATWKQIKEWLVKFYEAAFNQAARLKQRADKIIEVAKKANGQPKASQIKLGNLAQKIAIGSNVTADNIGVLEALVQEAASRGEVASQGIQKIREKLTEVGQSGSFTALVEAFNVAENSGDLRSAAFKTALQHDGKDGFATDVLPGNYKLFTYHPSKEGAGVVGRALAAYQLTHGYPVVRIDGDGGPAEDAATATLTPAQIISLAQRAKKIIEAFENTKKDIKAEALDLGNVQFSDKLEADQVKGLQSIINDITRAVRSSSNSQAKLAKVVITSAGDFLDVAAASLKQYSSAEAAAVAEPAAA